MLKCPNCKEEIKDGSIVCEFCKSWDVSDMPQQSEETDWPRLRAAATLYFLVKDFDNNRQVIGELFSLIPLKYEPNYNIFKKECIEHTNIDPEKNGMPPIKFVYPELKAFSKIKGEHFFDSVALEIIKKGIKAEDYKKSLFGKNLKMPDSLFEHFKNMLRVNFYQRIRGETKLSLESLSNFLSQRKREIIDSKLVLDEVLDSWLDKVKEKGIYLD